MTGKLTLIFQPDGKEPETWIDGLEVASVSVDNHIPWREIRTNPMMAAAMAGGASLVDLPGEKVAMMHDVGAEITITYEVRFRGKPAMTEFRKVFE